MSELQWMVMDNLPAPIARVVDPALRGGGAAPTALPATKATKGSVYFVQSGRRIKIGWTTSVAGRMKELQTGSPQILSLLTVLDGKTKADERALHKRFAAYHGHGEWFKLRGELLEYVCGLMGWPYPLPKGPPRCPRYYARLRAKAGVEQR